MSEITFPRIFRSRSRQSRVRNAGSYFAGAAHLGQVVARRARSYVPNLRVPGGLYGASAAGVTASALQYLRGKGVRVNNLMRSVGSGSGAVSVSKKSRRSSKRKLPGLPSRMKKQVKSIIKNTPAMNVLTTSNAQQMGQFITTINNVYWNQYYVPNLTFLKNYLTFESVETTAHGVTTLLNADFEDIQAQALAYKSFMIEQTLSFLMKNNSTGPGRLIFYILECTQDTDVAPGSDLDARMSAQIGTRDFANDAAAGTAVQAKETNFYQFWSTPSMANCHWKIKKKVDILIPCGDEITSSYSLKHRYQLRRQSELSYQKGYQCLVVRVSGVPSHSSAAVNSTCMSPVLVDFLSNIRTVVKCKGPIQTTPAKITVVRSGFAAVLDPVVGGDLTVAPVDNA